MKYIYHLKPEPFEGTALIPLNLMDKNSSLFKTHAEKYVGREALMLETIPKLNCKWNDVVQFLALDPYRPEFGKNLFEKEMINAITRTFNVGKD